ncbi:LexA regulated protein [Bacterioplanoides pacificum]|uniref:LexA regulated protein n=1 Tax=Bacterioplanoides pacificum TaxID=1171596 RepID=A0ABV7VSV2_9GAMM
MSVQPEDRTTIDMFARRGRGRPRSNPYDRALQCRQNKRTQRMRDKANDMRRLEVRIEGRVVDGLDDACELLNMSRAEIMELALKQWLHI